LCVKLLSGFCYSALRHLWRERRCRAERVAATDLQLVRSSVGTAGAYFSGDY
jgi:hypothetical protein